MASSTPPSPIALVVETVGPDDLASAVLKRIRLFRQAGVEEVWVVDGENRMITAWHRSRTGRHMTDEKAGAEADFFPVLRCSVSELLGPPLAADNT